MPSRVKSEYSKKFPWRDSWKSSSYNPPNDIIVMEAGIPSTKQYRQSEILFQQKHRTTMPKDHRHMLNYIGEDGNDTERSQINVQKSHMHLVASPAKVNRNVVVDGGGSMALQQKKRLKTVKPNNTYISVKDSLNIEDCNAEWSNIKQRYYSTNQNHPENRKSKTDVDFFAKRDSIDDLPIQHKKRDGLSNKNTFGVIHTAPEKDEYSAYRRRFYDTNHNFDEKMHLSKGQNRSDTKKIEDMYKRVYDKEEDMSATQTVKQNLYQNKKEVHRDSKKYYLDKENGLKTYPPPDSNVSKSAQDVEASNSHAKGFKLAETRKVASENQPLMRKAGLKPTYSDKGPHKPTEYEVKYNWKQPVVQSSPILAAEEIIHRNNPRVPPFVSDKITKQSEYKREFRDYSKKLYKSKEAPARIGPENSKSNPQLKKAANIRDVRAQLENGNKRETVSRSVEVTPDRMPAAGKKIFCDDYFDPRQQQPSERSNPITHMGPKKHSSEYTTNYHSPGEFHYHKGAWQGANPPHFLRDTQGKKSPHSESWRDEVKDVQDQAREYSKRTQGVHLNKENLDKQIKARTGDDVDSVSVRSNPPLECSPTLEDTRLDLSASTTDRGREAWVATPTSTQLSTLRSGGRLPTPKVDQLQISRHHLDRTTPAVGGALLINTSGGGEDVWQQLDSGEVHSKNGGDDHITREETRHHDRVRKQPHSDREYGLSDNVGYYHNGHVDHPQGDVDYHNDYSGGDYHHRIDNEHLHDRDGELHHHHHHHYYHYDGDQHDSGAAPRRIPYKVRQSGHYEEDGPLPRPAHVEEAVQMDAEDIRVEYENQPIQSRYYSNTRKPIPSRKSKGAIKEHSTQTKQLVRVRSSDQTPLQMEEVNVLFDKVPRGTANLNDDDHMSVLSLASSASLASEVLGRARKRRDEFWGKRQTTKW